MKRCFLCGVELFESYNNLFICKNCGIQPENQDVLESKDKNEKGGCPSYVN